MRFCAKPMLAAAMAAALGALYAPMAGAQGFAESWQAALQADARFRAARYELEAARYEVPMARAQLLPQVGINTSDSWVKGTRQTAGASGPVSSLLDYTARSRALTARMPVIDFDRWARLRVGEARVAYSEALFGVRAKELVDRLGQSYFELLLALESVGLAQAAVDTYTEAVAYAQQRLRGGEGTRTEVGEAEARLDIARAELIQANDAVEVARRSLQMITGRDPVSVRPLGGVPELAPVQPAVLSAWLERGQERSPEVATRRQQVEMARREVQRNRAGHYPKLEAVAAASRTENETVNTLGMETSQRSLGLQLSIPIYSGGYVDASTRQSVASLNKAEEDLAAELDTQRLEIRRQFLAATTGLLRIEALEKAVRSGEIALEGTRHGLRAGLRTNLDVLDATRLLFEARRNLVDARYRYLLAMMRLRVVAGDPIDEVVAEVDRRLRVAEQGQRGG